MGIKDAKYQTQLKRLIFHKFYTVIPWSVGDWFQDPLG